MWVIRIVVIDVSPTGSSRKGRERMGLKACEIGRVSGIVTERDLRVGGMLWNRQDLPPSRDRDRGRRTRSFPNRRDEKMVESNHARAPSAVVVAQKHLLSRCACSGRGN